MTGHMTSRERIGAALSHRRPDRLPIDLGAIRASGINAVVYHELKQRLGIDTPTKIHDPLQILAEIEHEVLDRLHCDVVPLEPATARWVHQAPEVGARRRLFCGTEVWFPPGTDIRETSDGSWVLLNAAGEPFARMPPDGYYFDFIRPTMDGRSIDPDAFRPREKIDDGELDALADHARFLYASTDRAILGKGVNLSFVGLSAMNTTNITQGSLDQWLMLLVLEKETAHEMMGRAVDAVIACFEQYHEAVGDRCVAWSVGSDDAGTQRGGLISPDLFNEMIAPHYRRLCDWVHTHTGWKTFLHTCGSVHHYIPGWIGAGIDIINPVQISAAGMEPERLMADFGGKIVFWGGGCDTQKVLPLGTPDEVRAHVRHNIEVFTSGSGGYVFNQVHNIQQNVPVENIEAMFDEAYRRGSEVYKDTTHTSHQS